MHHHLCLSICLFICMFVSIALYYHPAKRKLAPKTTATPRTHSYHHHHPPKFFLTMKPDTKYNQVPYMYRCRITSLPSPPPLPFMHSSMHAENKDRNDRIPRHPHVFPSHIAHQTIRFISSTTHPWYIKIRH